MFSLEDIFSVREKPVQVVKGLAFRILPEKVVDS